MMANRTLGARGGLKLNRTLGQSPRHRLASFGVLPVKIFGQCGGACDSPRRLEHRFRVKIANMLKYNKVSFQHLTQQRC